MYRESTVVFRTMFTKSWILHFQREGNAHSVTTVDYLLFEFFINKVWPAARNISAVKSAPWTQPKLPLCLAPLVVRLFDTFGLLWSWIVCVWPQPLTAWLTPGLTQQERQRYLQQGPQGDALANVGRSLWDDSFVNCKKYSLILQFWSPVWSAKPASLKILFWFWFRTSSEK